MGSCCFYSIGFFTKSERTSLPSLCFAWLNTASADKVSDTTGDAMKTKAG